MAGGCFNGVDGRGDVRLVIRTLAARSRKRRDSGMVGVGERGDRGEGEDDGRGCKLLQCSEVIRPLLLPCG